MIAVDQRGIGQTDKAVYARPRPTVALMDALGHGGSPWSGTTRGSHQLRLRRSPDRVERVALAEIPGPPNEEGSPHYFAAEGFNNKLWHIAVNRLQGVNEELIRGREDIYFGYEFSIQAGRKLPDDLVAYYVHLVSNPDALRGSFGFYRAFDQTIAQNLARRQRKLTIPVLAIGGAASFGAKVGIEMASLATDVQSAVLPGIGHWVAEEGPQETLAVLQPFLAPYR